MKKMKIKYLSTLLITMFFLLLFPLGVYAGEWQVNSSGTEVKYQNDDGSRPGRGWQMIDNVWYYFDTDGSAVTGWISDNSKYYYIDQLIYPVRNPASGDWARLLTNTTNSIDGREYTFDASGVCISLGDENNGFYWQDGIEYYRENGVNLTGWFSDGIMMYYAEESGKVDRSRSFLTKIIHQDGTLTEMEAKSIGQHLYGVENKVLKKYLNDKQLIYYTQLIQNEDGAITIGYFTFYNQSIAFTTPIALTHEFGHYVDYALLNAESSTERFHSIADPYLEAFAARYGDYCKTFEYEYFAEIFHMTFNSNSTISNDMKTNFPELYNYMVDLINSLQL